MEYEKMEVFYFSRSQGSFNPPPLNLTPLEGSILCPKTTWCYLGSIINFCFVNTLTFMPTKLFQQSNA